MSTLLTIPEKYVSEDKSWDWILSTLVIDDMFIHEVLLLMERKFSNKCPTMGVYLDHSRIILEVNPDFFKRLTLPEVRYVLKHECLHVVLHHCTTRLPEDPKEKDLWNTAADLAINSLIPETQICQIPKIKDEKTGKIVRTAQLPKAYGFPEKLSMEQYVQLLREKAKGGGDKGKNQPQGGKVGQQPQGGGQGQGGGQPQDGQGQGSGQPQDGQGQGSGQPQDGQEDQPQGIDSHDGWNKSEVADEKIRQKVEQMANQSTSWGTVSSDIKEMIIAAQKSQIAWHRILRNFFGHLLSTRKVHTFKRPNRRFGYPFSGIKRGYTDKKLVAIDTSGSVPDKALSQFLSECNKLADRCPVDVCLFDAEITQEPKPFSRKHAQYEFAGRGGTNFQPVCTLASERGYQSLIILTDGFAPAPEKPEGVKHIIWCITPDGQFPVEWGTQVKIDIITA